MRKRRRGRGRRVVDNNGTDSKMWKWLAIALASVMLPAAIGWFTFWQKLATQEYVNSAIKEAFRVDEKYYEATLRNYFKQVEENTKLITQIQINQASMEQKIDCLLEKFGQ